MLIKQITVVLLALSILSGCGLRLQQPLASPQVWQKIYISANNSANYLADELAQYLQAAGGKTVAQPAAAQFIIQLTNIVRGQDLISINSAQQTSQYNLTLAVTFVMLDNKGKVCIAPQTIRETRTLTVQVNQILAGNNAAAQLYKMMEHNLAYNIFLHLTKATAVTQTLVTAMASH